MKFCLRRSNRRHFLGVFLAQSGCCACSGQLGHHNGKCQISHVRITARAKTLFYRALISFFCAGADNDNAHVFNEQGSPKNFVCQINRFLHRDLLRHGLRCTFGYTQFSITLYLLPFALHRNVRCSIINGFNCKTFQNTPQ